MSRHWKTKDQDPYLAKVFPQPPLVAYMRPVNIKYKIDRAKDPDQTRSNPNPTRPKEVVNGMKKCHKCPICLLSRLSNLSEMILGQK